VLVRGELLPSGFSWYFLQEDLPILIELEVKWAPEHVWKFLEDKNFQALPRNQPVFLRYLTSSLDTVQHSLTRHSVRFMRHLTRKIGWDVRFHTLQKTAPVNHTWLYFGRTREQITDFKKFRVEVYFRNEAELTSDSEDGICKFGGIAVLSQHFII